MGSVPPGRVSWNTGPDALQQALDDLVRHCRTNATQTKRADQRGTPRDALRMARIRAAYRHRRRDRFLEASRVAPGVGLKVIARPGDSVL